MEFTVHPRVCGEHSAADGPPYHQPGSSPRMRGTFVLDKGALVDGRFIPAYAGNIKSRPPGLYKKAVHPRVCGEHSLIELRQLRADGSSPRMRGTLLTIFVHLTAHRFIPAYAGNMTCSQSSADKWPVHPRVCGEHNPVRMSIEYKGGSSPRMRGTSAVTLVRNLFGRFIPAYAGNMTVQGASAPRWAVHPRVCGEHLRPSRRGASFAGSSPRMRGTCAHTF